jgi:DNA-binding response OmpR family regulator
MSTVETTPDAKLAEQVPADDLGRILIADTDEAFCQATADLLRSKGYECDVAPDAYAAAKMLKRVSYSVVIADVDTPGNIDLGLVRALTQTAPGVRAIVTARQPDAETAAAAVELPVAAYLVKPIDSELLLRKVSAALRQACFARAVQGLGTRVRTWRTNLAEIERSLQPDSAGAPAISIDLFLNLTFAAIVEALADLRQLTAGLAGVATEREACHLIDCPRLAALRGAIAEAVDVLKETKGAFKSKRLGDLRKSLEKCLGENLT